MRWCIPSSKPTRDHVACTAARHRRIDGTTRKLSAATRYCSAINGAKVMGEYTQWFHFCQWRLENAGDSVSMVSPSGRTVLVRHLSGAQLVTSRGQKQPKPQGWVTESYGNMVDRQALGYSAGGSAVRLVTLFGFDASAADEASAAVSRYAPDPEPAMGTD